MKLSSFLIPLVPSLVTAFTVAPLVPKTSSSSALFLGALRKVILGRIDTSAKIAFIEMIATQ